MTWTCHIARERNGHKSCELGNVRWALDKSQRLDLVLPEPMALSGRDHLSSPRLWNTSDKAIVTYLRYLILARGSNVVPFGL